LTLPDAESASLSAGDKTSHAVSSIGTVNRTAANFQNGFNVISYLGGLKEIHRSVQQMAWLKRVPACIPVSLPDQPCLGAAFSAWRQ
jgi:hypothetical protein